MAQEHSIEEGEWEAAEWRTSGAAQVEQTALSQHNNAVAVGEDEAVHLCSRQMLSTSTNACQQDSKQAHGTGDEETNNGDRCSGS